MRSAPPEVPLGFVWRPAATSWAAALLTFDALVWGAFSLYAASFLAAFGASEWSVPAILLSTIATGLTAWGVWRLRRRGMRTLVAAAGLRLVAAVRWVGLMGATSEIVYGVGAVVMLAVPVCALALLRGPSHLAAVAAMRAASTRDAG